MKKQVKNRESLCLRCGECCKLPDGSDCPFLKRLPNGKTLCTIYATRLGTMVAPGIICSTTDDPNALGFADNCPYKQSDNNE